MHTSLGLSALLFAFFFFYCFRLLTASSQAKGPSVCYQNWRRSTTSLRVKTTQSSLWTMSCLLQTATSFPACSTYGLQARLVKVPLRYCVCVWPAWRGQEAESHSRTCCEQPHERYRMPFIVSVLRIKTSVACFFFHDPDSHKPVSLTITFLTGQWCPLWFTMYKTLSSVPPTDWWPCQCQLSLWDQASILYGEQMAAACIHRFSYVDF